jgi:hypothetical protein
MGPPVRIWIVGALQVLLLCGTVKANEPDKLGTAHNLYRTCTSGIPLDATYCLGFIRGVGATMRVGRELLDHKEETLSWCHSEEVSNAQMLQAFKNWHDMHPESWKFNAEVGVMLALAQTWPCTAR